MVFTSTMGIPCAYKLKEIENSKRALGINNNMINGIWIGDAT